MNRRADDLLRLDPSTRRVLHYQQKVLSVRVVRKQQQRVELVGSEVHRDLKVPSTTEYMTFNF